MKFYEIIKSLMAEKNITQKALCKELGISKNSFAYWKSTGAIPKRGTLKLIADYFDVSVAYLLGETDIKKETVQDERSESETFQLLMQISSRLSDKNLAVLRSVAETLASEQEQEDN